MRRAPLLAVAAVVAAALGSGGVRPAGADLIDCPAWGRPTDVTLTVKDFGNPYIEVRWNPADIFAGPWEFVEWVVERSGEGEDFAPIAQSNVAIDPTNGYAYQYVAADGQDCTGGCLTPGGTYTYRVAGKFTYNPAVCRNADGAAHLTLYSDEATITAPGGDPPAQPPKDLAAVADTKKNLVTVTWTNPEGLKKDDKLVLERRVVSSPKAGPGAKDFGDFAALALMRATVAKFADRSVQPDTEYEYQVAVLVDQQIAARSRSDKAFTRGACARSDFRVWDGAWVLEDEAGAKLDEGVEFKEGAFREDEYGFEGKLKCWDPLCPTTPGSSEFDTLAALGGGPIRFNSMPAFKMLFLTQIPFFGVEFGTKGRLTAEMQNADPFAADAWLKAKMTFSFHGRPDVALVGRDNPTYSATKLCTSIGVAKSLKGGIVAPGDVAVFAIKTVCLGHSPLYAGNATMAVSIEGGTLVHAAPNDWLRERTAETTSTSANFDVGAIGPLSPGKSEQAILVVFANAGASDGQLRCNVRVQAVGGPNNEFVESVGTPYAEVRIGATLAAK